MFNLLMNTFVTHDSHIRLVGLVYTIARRGYRV